MRQQKIMSRQYSSGVEKNSVEFGKTIIQVSEVSRAVKPLPNVPYYEAVEALLDKPKLSENLEEVLNQEQIEELELTSASQKERRIESCSRYRGQLLANVAFHPVIAAIHLAYNDHRPLCLSPDHIWLLICQGLANHINMNSETLRSQVVKHEGTVKIDIRRDDFIKGSPDNPWDEIIGDFSTAIRHHIGDAMHNRLLPTFSTTGRFEQAAAEIVLLDSMQSYFEYEFHTICGIPEIKLEGTVYDWQTLLTRTQEFSQFGLAWWINPLVNILENFIKTVEGKVEQAFWQSIYQLDNQCCGGPYILGWITAFFPYLKDWQTGKATTKNEWLSECRRAQHDFF